MRYSIIIILITALMACSQDKSEPSSADSATESNNKQPVIDPQPSPAPKLSILAQIKASGKIIILTRNSPTTYYYKQDELAGFEYELGQAFAKSLGVKAEFKTLNTVSEIFSHLAQGKGHIAAAGLTLTARRKTRFMHSRRYFQVQQQVVCRQGGRRPRNLKQLLSANLLVIANSSYTQQLRKLKTRQPDLVWKETATHNTEELLDMVWKGEIDCTIADSNIVAINRRYYPELVVMFDISQAQPLVWYLGSDAKGLQQQLDIWFDQQAWQEIIEWLDERYYGFISFYNYVNTKTFLQSIETVLPKYDALFREAADNHNLDWTLLAAQAYQESLWNPRAKSPTGVRGIMMLTLNTARFVKIKNRLDSKQSIFGGAEYFKSIKKRLPESITGPDRTWIALAAYNIGLGHILDARHLARQFKKNPDSWTDLKSVLPLLHKKKYYQTLKYGYARGTEPVRYVARIRDFHDLLLNHLNDRNKPATASTRGLPVPESKNVRD